MALKGHPQPGAPLLPKRPTFAGRHRVPLFVYGSTAAKDELYGRLGVLPPGPRSLHLRDTVDAEYLKQLTGEVPYVQPRGPSRGRRVYRKRRARTEALDCACYAFLAFEQYGRERLKAPPAGPTDPPEAPAEEAPEIPQVGLVRNIGMELAAARARPGRGGRPRAGYFGMKPWQT